MATKRPKSSLPNRQPLSGSNTSQRRKLSSTFPEDSDSSENLKVLKEVTSIPGAVRVCSGTYSTSTGQTISKGTILYLHEKFSRNVVQFECLHSNKVSLVNISLSSGICIGFKHSTVDFSNVKKVTDQHRTLPKVLSVTKACQCNAIHHTTISELDVFIVVTVSKQRELFVMNVLNDKIIKLPQKCDASFTTDPKQACIPVESLENMSPESLHGVQIVFKKSSDVSFLESPTSITFKKIDTEDCLRVQTDSSVDIHLLPLDVMLKVVPVPNSKSQFPESAYELMESDVRSQITKIDYMKEKSLRKLSQSSCGSLPKSRPCSGRGTISSIKTSYSSFGAPVVEGMFF